MRAEGGPGRGPHGRSATGVVHGMELAQKLVRVLDEHGVLAYWVTEEEAEKLAQLCDVEAWILDVSAPGMN